MTTHPAAVQPDAWQMILKAKYDVVRRQVTMLNVYIYILYYIFIFMYIYIYIHVAAVPVGSVLLPCSGSHEDMS